MILYLIIFFVLDSSIESFLNEVVKNFNLITNFTRGFICKHLFYDQWLQPKLSSFRNQIHR